MTLRFDPIEVAAQNWASRDWGAIDAMRAAASITRVHQVMLARIETALAPLGLNFSRFEVLALLSFTQRGELPMGKIGDRLQVHPASVTNTISRLESDGLVERRVHPADGRTRLACVRPAGRALVEEAEQVLAAISYGLEGLDLDEFAPALEALTGYRKANGDFEDADPG